MSEPITQLDSTPPDLEALWTVTDVARYLRVPVETLRYWRKCRTGPPAVRLGKHLRYDPAAVRAWFANQAAA
ncbi:helix-turn-helix domain-containing protein [Rugosimonospora africana]|uniref:Helix-turn-helix domain-containing protein n=1 Tax=Rugosimonospora africana TaxID=556532 RepID=A0A8J3VQP2_9ACTN|nr:helix-turn-helix domain-containing protein [Rugosimonospora africana]GIH14696.1 hypothetical protein Raf01_28680 [Rugosimonospora africana]